MSVLGTMTIIMVAVLIGTVLQRLSGTGVGLVVAPVLSLLLGPALGVLVTNMTTVVSGLLIMISVWSAVSWRDCLRIIPFAVVGAVPGAWVVSQLSVGWLSIILGSIVVLALVVTVTLRRVPHISGALPAALTGFIGGFFNTTSGVAAPVMVIYSRLTRWEQRSFAATLQPIFMSMGLASVLAKLTMGSVDTSGQADLPLLWVAPGIVVTVVLGIVLGNMLGRRVPVRVARTLAMSLAALGGVAAIGRGLMEVFFG